MIVITQADLSDIHIEVSVYKIVFFIFTKEHPVRFFSLALATAVLAGLMISCDTNPSSPNAEAEGTWYGPQPHSWTMILKSDGSISGSYLDSTAIVMENLLALFGQSSEISMSGSYTSTDIVVTTTVDGQSSKQQVPYFTRNDTLFMLGSPANTESTEVDTSLFLRSP